MRRALLQCDGASAPASLRLQDWDVSERIFHRGSKANLNLNIESPAHALLTGLEDRAADLVRIAAYVYAADQMVSRGGDADVFGDNWERHFTMCIPVTEPELWGEKRVLRLLREVLRFATGDSWTFQFSRSVPNERQLPFHIDPAVATSDPDSVFLFSGGIDSLCAVVEAAFLQGKKPLLVGHSPAYHIQSRQRRLAEILGDRHGRWKPFPYLSVAIHRMGSDPRDYSQRSRAFLYASLGVAIAHLLGLNETMLPDNGVVSLNLPINNQLFGTKASRSTHPKFLFLFNQLAQVVLPKAPILLNPLWSRTRAEGLEILKKAHLEPLLEETNSCSHPRALTKMRPHCGICSQCIDRRFATLAAGLEQYDPGDRYNTEVFLGALSEGGARTMALSYARFGAEVLRTPPEEMFCRFPELVDALSSSYPNQRHVAEALTGLLQRHAAGVARVMEEQVRRAAPLLALRQLPTTCLVRLYISDEDVQGVVDFRPNADYRQVWLRGQKFELTPNQARVVELLHSHRLRGSSSLSQDYILVQLDIKSANLSQVFRGSKAWGKLIVRSGGRGMYRLNF